jgi:hypothetical protein
MPIRTAIALLLCLAAAAADPKPPSPEEQQRVIEAARRAALAYDRTLPDFLCAEAVSRYSDPTGEGKYWSAVDSLMVLLSYYGRQEHYRLVPDNGPYDSLPGATTQGEFGAMLRRVFDPAFAAEFDWHGYEDFRDTHVQVYSYKVSRKRSTFSLIYTKGRKTGQIKAGYHGLVYISPPAGTALRITTEVDDLDDFQVSFASTTLDYGYSTIAGSSYLLPLRAVTLMHAGDVMTKNVVDFKSYQKFDAGVEVHYMDTEESVNRLR